MRPFFIFLKNKFGPASLVGAEIGVKEGDNASEILENLSIKKLLLVDSWAPFECYSPDVILRQKYLTQEYQDFCFNKVKQRFKGYGNVQIVRQPSSVAARRCLFPDKFDFVYIDAVHTHKMVMEDCQVWYPRVKRDGYLGGHDYCNIAFPGVQKAVNEFAKIVNKNIGAGRGDPDWWLV